MQDKMATLYYFSGPTTSLTFLSKLSLILKFPSAWPLVLLTGRRKRGRRQPPHAHTQCTQTEVRKELQKVAILSGVDQLSKSVLQHVD